MGAEEFCMVKALITGAAGFIGHHVVDYLLKNTDWQLTLIDRLDCSGNLNRLAEIGAAKNPRVKFVYHDLRAPLNGQLTKQIGFHDYVLHLAAATHVDRSITHPLEFVYDNVVATCNILDFARVVGCGRFLYFSTDEVFGPAPEGVRYLEDDRYRSGNPYAATKAGGEELAVSYANTYKLPVLITHTMNVIGRRQHPEKMVPMTIQKVDRGEKVIIHSDPTKTKPGSRFYIDAEDVADGVRFVLDKGVVGRKYNLVGDREVDNLELAQMISSAVGKPLDYEQVDFHGSRPGHDLRYALDGSKLANMGWIPRPIFGRVHDVVRWTLNNQQWLLAA
jgi:dTDP-glucose 4,6-dehydratase